MKPYIFFILYFLFLGNILSPKAQLLQRPTSESYQFFDGSSDILIFDGEKYLLEKTPLDVFPEYDKIYPELPYVLIEILPGYGSMDKNYEVEWILTDSMLYLSNITFEYCLGLDPGNAKEIYPNNEHFVRMEKLTQRKFEKYNYLKGFIYIPNPHGVIKADWVTGIIHMKKPQGKNESYKSWAVAPSYRLVFKKGKLISKSEAPAWIDTFTGIRYSDDVRRKEWTLRMEYKNGKLIDIKKIKYRGL